MRDKRSEVYAIAENLVGEAALSTLSQIAECVYVFKDDNSRGAQEILVGASHFGGSPDLPNSVPWPLGRDAAGNAKGHALFYAQFNLADVPSMEMSPLPLEGMLWVFCTRDLQNFDPPLVEVIYSSETSHLTTRVPPSKWLTSQQAVPLTFVKGLSLPLGNRPFLAERLRNKSVASKLFGPLLNCTAPADRIGQIGGYAIDEGDTPDDLYRRLAITKLGGREYILGDQWPTEAEFDDYVRHETGMFSRARNLPPEILELRTAVNWLAAHGVEIEAESASWRLLLELKAGIRSGLDFGAFKRLAIFTQKSRSLTEEFNDVTAEYLQW